jgi:hypothetical protein
MQPERTLNKAMDRTFTEQLPTVDAKLFAVILLFSEQRSLSAIVGMSPLGHSRPMRSKPRDDVCPLLPESGQIADRLGMSA